MIRSRKCRCQALFLGLLCALFYASAIHAEPHRLLEGPGDRPLVLHAVVDSHGKGSASANVQLTSPGKAVQSLRLLASDLMSADTPARRIDRSEVSCAAGISLSADQPQDIRITIANIAHSGVYKGTLRFYVPEQAEPALVLPVELLARAQPDVKSPQPSLSRQSVRCGGRLGCALASAILPSGLLNTEWLVPLDNHTAEPVTIEEAAVMLRGDKSGAVLPASALLVKGPLQLPANRLFSLSLRLSPEQIAADSYHGQLRLKLQGSDEPLLLNVDLSMREGPLLALVVIVLGICMGRLVRQMDSTEVQKQLKLLARYRVTLQRSASVKSPDAVSHLQYQLELVKRRIEDARDTEEAITATLDQLEARIDFLRDLERLGERAMNLNHDKTAAAEIAGKLAQARTVLLQDKVAEAEALRKEVIGLLTLDGPMGDGDETSESASSAASHKLAPMPLASPQPSRFLRIFGRVLGALSGVRVSTAELRYWLVRPVLAVVLLVLLTLLGLQTLYVNAGSSFGAAGLYDYLGLFLWGLSADVAQRTLHSLPAAAEARRAES